MSDDIFVINFLAWVVVVFLGALVMLIRALMVRRAVFQVIRIMRDRRSRCSETPKTMDELGLEPPSLFERLSRPKDYKPHAIDALIHMGILRVFEDGRICLSEDRLRDVLPD